MESHRFFFFFTVAHSSDITQCDSVYQLLIHVHYTYFTTCGLDVSPLVHNVLAHVQSRMVLADSHNTLEWYLLTAIIHSHLFGYN